MKSALFAATAMLAALPAQAQPAPALPPPPPAYADDGDWLCLPGRPADPCGAPLPTTALNANGYGSVGRSRIAANPPVDCFYVYPTVSRDVSINSDLEMGENEEIAMTRIQFARFAEQCRTFAPKYRSITLSGMVPAFAGQDVTSYFDIAYSDVRNAWRQFLASRSQGGPFILVAHSQGSIHLQRLIREEIEGKPIAARMVSAIIPGWNVEVPEGQAVGGTFRSTPLCTRPGQTGCVASFVSFRAETPPPETGAMFGRSPRAGFTVACTNPAALGGGRAPLDSYWFAPSELARDIAWSREGAAPTPFLRTEGLASGECVRHGPVGYLAISVNADPADGRTDRIPGDVVLMGRPVHGWGLHPVDMPLVLGDLLRLIEAQIAAFLTSQGERG